MKIIHAGPTAGKDFLALTSKADVVVVDTDQLTIDLLGDLWSPGVWHKNDTLSEKIQTVRDKVVAKVGGLTVISNPKAVLVTNLWGKVFVSQLPSALLVGGKLPFGCFRTDISDFVDLWNARGSSKTDHKVFNHWAKTFLKYSGDVFEYTLLLQSGEFLDDFLTADGTTGEVVYVSPSLSSIARIDSESKRLAEEGNTFWALRWIREELFEYYAEHLNSAPVDIKLSELVDTIYLIHLLHPKCPALLEKFWKFNDMEDVYDQLSKVCRGIKAMNATTKANLAQGINRWNGKNVLKGRDSRPEGDVLDVLQSTANLLMERRPNA